jgi:hypothetical protein
MENSRITWDLQSCLDFLTWQLPKKANTGGKFDFYILSSVKSLCGHVYFPLSSRTAFCGISNENDAWMVDGDEVQNGKGLRIIGSTANMSR